MSAPFRITGPGAAKALSCIEIGEGTRIGQFGWFSLVEAAARITIGRGCTLNSGLSITVRSSVTIGDGTAIGDRCLIMDHAHDHRPYLERAMAAGERPTFGWEVTEPEPVVIGSGVHMGVNVVISPGVEIGDGAVVGANSVVTSTVPPFTVVAGAPARRLRSALPERP